MSKVKFAGSRAKWILELPLIGLSLLNDHPGTLGIVKARIMPAMTQRINKMMTKRTRDIPGMQQNPFSSRRKAFHFDVHLSMRCSRFADLVMARSSDFCHSAPSAGTVTSSTGPLPASDNGVSGLEAPAGN